jgi:hypothetical protein
MTGRSAGTCVIAGTDQARCALVTPASGDVIRLIGQIRQITMNLLGISTRCFPIASTVLSFFRSQLMLLSDTCYLMPALHTSSYSPNPCGPVLALLDQCLPPPNFWLRGQRSLLSPTEGCHCIVCLAPAPHMLLSCEPHTHAVPHTQIVLRIAHCPSAITL